MLLQKSQYGFYIGKMKDGEMNQGVSKMEMVIWLVVAS